MKKRILSVVCILVLLFTFTACDQNSAHTGILESVPRYLDCLGLTQSEVYEKLGLDMTVREIEGISINVTDLIETVEGTDFEVTLVFLKDYLQSVQFVYQPSSELTDADFDLTEKLCELMRAEYGEPYIHPMRPGQTLSVIVEDAMNGDIKQLKNQDRAILTDYWNIPMPTSLSERIDTELTYLESYVSVRKNDMAPAVVFGFGLTSTEKQAAEQGWVTAGDY